MNDLRKTPLHYAVLNNDYEEVKKLVESGADVNVRDQGFVTPLHEAVLNGRKEIVDFLCKHNADIEAEELYDSCTPLMIAANNGEVDIVKILLQYGANIHHKDADGDTAYEYADSAMNEKEIKELLKQYENNK